LYQRITEGVMQGRLGAKEADDLKRDFYRVMDNEAKYRSSGGLSFGEQAALAIELEKLANSIESSMKETNAVLPDVDTRQAELDKKLANALAGGLVSTTQVSEITRELDRIAREEVNYRFSGNGLSYAESSSLMAELERVDNRINTMLAGRKVQWSGIDNRLLEAREEIEEGVAARRLSAAQASELKAELDRIAQAKLAFEASGGGLTVAETSSLVRDLERFNINLNARLGKISQKIAWTDIDARQARVEAKLNQSKMPVATANRVKRELKDLAIKKALYRASGNAFSYKELTSLAQTLDRLDGMVGIKVQ
jgi:chaperonin cofactor prefoldin